MDRREKINDPVQQMLIAMQGNRAETWTALPGYLISFDPAKMTASVQLTLRSRVQRGDHEWEWINFPPLVDCPISFPAGGGAMLTFPLTAGDEVLVIFASRCIDNWWLMGGIQDQAEIRMHDLSDGFCIPGPRSLPNVPAGISTSKVQLRNLSSSAVVELDPASGSVSITATQINLNGTLIINGTNYDAHQHSGVATGGSNTGGVVV